MRQANTSSATLCVVDALGGSHGAASAATSKLILGSGICLLPQHNHFNAAKAIASLDMLSGGRIVFGIGGGWNVEEMNDHGAEYKTRFKLMRERILAMKALWTEEEGEFHGEMVDFDPAWSHPKPVQKPHPLIVLGGETDYTLRRVVEFCDGWLLRWPARRAIRGDHRVGRLPARQPNYS